MAKGDEERERRLADALRQNLRRRKAQARGEKEPPALAASDPCAEGRADLADDRQTPSG
ncbi:MAG: hypothetical protein M3N39_12000 [Pseudomonadota bacterium]|nr:hypothetical protein [Pseudomonadota bacterium]